MFDLIQRETLIWLTVKPKLQPAKDLRQIIKKLHLITMQAVKSGLKKYLTGILTMKSS